MRNAHRIWPGPALAAVGLAVSIVAPASAQIPCRYEVAHIIQAPTCGITGPPPTIGTDISPNGRYVCGYWYDCDFGYHAFLYDAQNQQFTTLPYPQGVVSMKAADVNDNAMVVGELEHDPGYQYQGYVWNSETGQYTYLLPNPGGAWAAATAINNSNVVCGYRSIGSPGDPVNPFEAFIWSSVSGYQNLGLVNGLSTAAADINENSTICGTYGGGQTPFIWNRGQWTMIRTAPGSEAYAIAMNDNNDVVGRIGFFVPSFTLRAFVWRSGEFFELGTLPGDNRSAADDINNNSIVVGSSRLVIGSSTVSRPFIWHDGVMRNLADLVSGASGPVLQGAGAINDENWVLAYAGGSTIVLRASAIDGDVNGDCRSDIDDLLAVINYWGESGSKADLNQDGTVNIDDLLIVINNWSPQST